MINDFEIINIEKPSLLKNNVKVTLKNWIRVFPESKASQILIKPNFNSSFDALTGNTTDMRLLAAVIEFLKDEGYNNIIIAEGTSSGFFREGISVINRLGADLLASKYRIDIIDINTWPNGSNVPLKNNDSTQIADVMINADFIINMPKLKTHFEVGMSVCLKNLIGTCIGLENKKKIHGNLARNIIHLNETIKPDLHIIDGIIAMEGDGPSRGVPVNFGKVIIGKDPYKLDYLCARLTQFPIDEIQTLVEANKIGKITDEKIKNWENIPLDGYKQEFKRPCNSMLVSFVIDPRFQKHLIRIRYAPIIRAICSTQIIKNIFYLIGISQERIIPNQSNFMLTLDRDICNECNKCIEYCPMGIDIDGISQNGGDRCIRCLYCFSVCPKQAIKLKGDLGYFYEQINIYGDTIKQIA